MFGTDGMPVPSSGTFELVDFIKLEASSGETCGVLIVRIYENADKTGKWADFPHMAHPDCTTREQAEQDMYKAKLMFEALKKAQAEADEQIKNRKHEVDAMYDDIEKQLKDIDPDKIVPFDFTKGRKQ